MPITIFLSPSIHDDATVTALRKALEPRSVSVWADLQLLSAGDALTTRIQEAIREPQHFRADIEKFCKARRLIDLVPGHVVLGLLRRIVLLAVRRQSGRNPTVKRILNAVLTRCEWGKDDYSLAVANLPPRPMEPGTQTSLFEEAQL